MKKSLKIFTVIAVAVLAFSITGQAFAQSPDQDFPVGTGRGNRRGGGTNTSVLLEMNISLDSALEELLHAYLAEAIGIDPSELEDGNFHEIALALGYDITEINEIGMQAHSDALAQALFDGLVTQEEYDWLSRDRGFMGSADGMGYGTGVCTGDCTVDGAPLFDGSRQCKGFRGGK